MLQSHLWRRRIASVAALPVLFLTACGDSQAPGPSAHLALTPPWAAIVVGDTISGGTTVRAIYVDPQGDTVAANRVTWSSSDTAVARVDAAGVVRSVAEGVTTIEATYEGATARQRITVTPPVLVGAGDIGSCESNRDSITGRLLDSIAGVVFTAGDNDYSDSDPPPAYGVCFESAWGRHKARVRPAPGEDDERNGNLNAYYGYFGAAAHPPLGYYSYELGTWHVVVLNTSPTADATQINWLQADLAAHPALCTVVIDHRPRFSSGNTGSSTGQAPVFEVLADAGVDVLISGNDHDYERFAPQEPDQSPDPTGVVQFVVGTGGKSHGRINQPLEANSVVQNDDTYGVLKLTLRPGSYDWKFVPIPGRSFTDSGSASCH